MRMHRNQGHMLTSWISGPGETEDVSADNKEGVYEMWKQEMFFSIDQTTT